MLGLNNMPAPTQYEDWVRIRVRIRIKIRIKIRVRIRVSVRLVDDLDLACRRWTPVQGSQ